jgi:hypothetical protein
MGPTALLRPEKSDGFGRGFEPANLGTKGQQSASRPQEPFTLLLILYHIFQLFPRNHSAFGKYKTKSFKSFF